MLKTLHTAALIHAVTPGGVLTYPPPSPLCFYFLFGLFEFYLVCLRFRFCWLYSVVYFLCVYSTEEIFRSHAAHWWSPDGLRLAYATIDDTLVPKMEIPTFTGGLYPGAQEYRYPKVSSIRVRWWNGHQSDGIKKHSGASWQESETIPQ